MALELAYTDPAGNEHAASHWRVRFVLMDLDRRVGRAVLKGFKDAAAFDAGRAPLGGAEFTLTVDGDRFAGIEAAAAAGPFDPVAIAYQLAAADPFFAAAAVV